MSTTPPEGGTHGAAAGPGGATARSPFGTASSPGDLVRLPIPGTAEFLFLVAALILLAIIAAIADRFDVNGWVTALEILGAAYLLSRGVAKASRVLEH